ncbi:hypothetical protein [Streptomyces sp. NPDC014623]|uniref:hypothetical protein n=1 Tax=Streptomyces sp. NPDC014623 TaxID=3364875 RepID=UPI0036FBFA11
MTTDPAAEIRAAESRLCGKTVAVNGATHPPCARTAGHREAYCRDSTYSSYFLAAPAVTEKPAR